MTAAPVKEEIEMALGETDFTSDFQFNPTSTSAPSILVPCPLLSRMCCNPRLMPFSLVLSTTLFWSFSGYKQKWPVTLGLLYPCSPCWETNFRQQMGSWNQSSRVLGQAPHEIVQYQINLDPSVIHEWESWVYLRSSEEIRMQHTWRSGWAFHHSRLGDVRDSPKGTTGRSFR